VYSSNGTKRLFFSAIWWKHGHMPFSAGCIRMFVQRSFRPYDDYHITISRHPIWASEKWIKKMAKLSKQQYRNIEIGIQFCPILG
jgi:ribonuclease BN (tRNA processing enzyme)